MSSIGGRVLVAKDLFATLTEAKRDAYESETVKLKKQTKKEVLQLRPSLVPLSDEQKDRYVPLCQPSCRSLTVAQRAEASCTSVKTTVGVGR